MEPQNPFPQPGNNPNPYQVRQPNTFSSPQAPVPASAPIPPKKSKKLAIILVIIVLLAGAIGTLYALSKKNKEPKSEAPQSALENKTDTDKEGIQKSVNAYCQELAKSYGFTGMSSGYIISDRYSEDMLSDSPALLRFKQIGDAASATVDCERGGEAMGISNDLLFVKDNGTWNYVDEVQNNMGSGFLCSITEQHNVSKELVGTCAPSKDAKTQSR